MRTWKRLLATSCCAGAAALLGACGDDGGGSGDDTPDIDANTEPDADETPPDAMPMATRGMTVAVSDVALTSPNAMTDGVRGGVISIEFSDLTQGGGEVIYGTSPVGGCVVVKYDATHPPNPVVDAGTVTISGPETGQNGLRKAVGPCTFANGQYTCSSHGSADETAAATDLENSLNNPPGLIAYTFPNQTFPTTTPGDLVGSYLIVGGFTNAAYNTPAGTAFPIISQQGPNTLVVFNPAAEGQAIEADAGGRTFAVLNGFAPAPVGSDGDFLGDETGEVRIQKADHENWAAFDETFFVRGQGFTLSDASTQPHEFPTTAKAIADITFTCEGAGGDCGDEPTQTGVLRAVIVSGRTTDVDVSALPKDYMMPPASAATEYTAFQCGFLLANGGTIPQAAVEAILSTNPTRIETRILRVIGSTPMDGLNEGRILVGHGLVGHTTVTSGN